MQSFIQFEIILEGGKVTVPALKGLIESSDKIFVLFGGTIGAGKSYWANNHLKGLIPIIDQDDIAVEMAGTQEPAEVIKHTSAAIRAKITKTKQMIASGESFVDMGTMAGLKSATNKIENAKKHGYTTIAIFISTDPKTALERNRSRIAGGGRGILPEKEGKIAAQYEKAIEAFKVVKRHKDTDYYLEIKS